MGKVGGIEEQEEQFDNEETEQRAGEQEEKEAKV